jgi:hypothetical protein
MSFNISVPEELIQDVSDQNVIVSGHSQLVDVSCQHLEVDGNAILDKSIVFNPDEIRSFIFILKPKDTGI